MPNLKNVLFLAVNRTGPSASGEHVGLRVDETIANLEMSNCQQTASENEQFFVVKPDWPVKRRRQ